MKSSSELPPSSHSANKEQEHREHWERIRPYLRAVSSTESRSGDERLVREYLMQEAEALGIETRTDQAGNLWLLSDAPESGILLCSHMDKVGKANAIKTTDGQITGRLDDALGISIIMGALKKGHRPSVLFTTEEEVGLYGSKYAADMIMNGDAKCPKLALILDVSALKKRGAGPLMYISSGRIPFPEEPIEAVKNILKRHDKRATFLDGWPNDSINFAMISTLTIENHVKKVLHQPTLTLQVHVDNIHRANETADIVDIEEAASVLETILQNHGQLPEPSAQPFTDFLP